ncbi:DUF1566 domain-containing protein [Paraglaciecola sp. L3A3]|uniref:Lcl C-terminal domain-containing protein n=1 Tax=Paraglaciecola sp. L3A3 TaxID=2686358 RepID=UPI00131DAA77|nr:DUF1566 domain-containing protein [Paraglaciecola sp. L3A3]
MKVVQKLLTVILVVSVLLTSCSGGSLDSDSNEERAKVIVNAGRDQIINEQTVINLNAQATGQSENLSFSWRASPALEITHDDTSTGLATFTTPITTKTLTYTFTSVVLDEEGNRGTDEVIFTIAPVNDLPTAVLTVPDFAGLSANQFPAGEVITLNAANSLDSDPPTNTAAIAEYLWQQTAGESVLTGVNTLGGTLSFITPILDEPNVISISVTVTDQEGAVDTEIVDLNIQSASQTLPKIAAGVSHEVFSGESINLNGVASTNIAASRPLIANWLNDSENAPVIDSSNNLQTFAIAPTVLSSQDLTFTLQIEDKQGNQVEDSVTVTIKPLPIQPLNDTGVSQQANNSQVLSSYQADFPGQDGQRGQDVIYQNGMSAKAGRGEQGFDFTKLDVIGDEVDDPTQDWSCIRDNITGLVWEVKTAFDSAGLHTSSSTVSWYEESEDEDLYLGDELGANASCTLALCNTSAYITAVNTQGLCNFRDWRLPTHEELLSIVHFGKTSSPTVDELYFPYTTTSLGSPVWYWTQDSSADGMSELGAQNAWAIDFTSGNDNFLNKSTAAHIRLVRAGR